MTWFKAFGTQVSHLNSQNFSSFIWKMWFSYPKLFYLLGRVVTSIINRHGEGREVAGSLLCPPYLKHAWPQVGSKYLLYEWVHEKSSTGHALQCVAAANNNRKTLLILLKVTWTRGGGRINAYGTWIWNITKHVNKLAWYALVWLGLYTVSNEKLKL